VIGWRISPKRKRSVIIGGLVVAVLSAACQWYLYDAIHAHAERFTYYLVTCAYLSGVLTPAVLLLGRRWHIDSSTWKRALPIHVAASLLLSGLGVLVEATIGWLPYAAQWPYSSALRHYFTQHTQISIITYWALLGAFHVYRIYDQARRREVRAAQLEAELREAQLTALRNQLQPHFLFNTLQAATTSIYDDPQGAEEILLSLSELLRVSLQVFEHQELPLHSEVEFLRHYAGIQQRRFGERLRFDFQIDPQSESCAVPTLLLQPLVENAICHGIGVRKQSDVISVRALRTKDEPAVFQRSEDSSKDRLNIEVENRVSVLEGTLETLLSRGVGLANTIARLEHLYGREQSFAIRNLSPQGVIVSISIPVRLFQCA
jgi:two-component system, LytTR family, sensor kinase